MSLKVNPSRNRYDRDNRAKYGYVLNVPKLPNPNKDIEGLVVFLETNRYFYRCDRVENEVDLYWKWSPVTIGTTRVYLVPVGKLAKSDIDALKADNRVNLKTMFNDMVNTVNEIIFGFRRYDVIFEPLGYKQATPGQLYDVPLYQWEWMDRPYYEVRSVDVTEPTSARVVSYSHLATGTFAEQDRPTHVAQEGDWIAEDIQGVSVYTKLMDKINELVDFLNEFNGKLGHVTLNYDSRDSDASIDELADILNSVIDYINPFAISWQIVLDRYGYIEGVVGDFIELQNFWRGEFGAEAGEPSFSTVCEAVDIALRNKVYVGEFPVTLIGHKSQLTHHPTVWLLDKEKTVTEHIIQHADVLDMLDDEIHVNATAIQKLRELIGTDEIAFTAVNTSADVNPRPKWQANTEYYIYDTVAKLFRWLNPSADAEEGRGYVVGQDIPSTVENLYISNLKTIDGLIRKNAAAIVQNRREIDELLGTSLRDIYVETLLPFNEISDFVVLNHREELNLAETDWSCRMYEAGNIKVRLAGGTESNIANLTADADLAAPGPADYTYTPYIPPAKINNGKFLEGAVYTFDYYDNNGVFHGRNYMVSETGAAKYTEAYMTDFFNGAIATFKPGEPVPEVGDPYVLSDSTEIVIEKIGVLGYSVDSEVPKISPATTRRGTTLLVPVEGYQFDPAGAKFYTPSFSTDMNTQSGTNKTVTWNEVDIAQYFVDHANGAYPGSDNEPRNVFGPIYVKATCATAIDQIKANNDEIAKLGDDLFHLKTEVYNLKKKLLTYEINIEDIKTFVGLLENEDGIYVGGYKVSDDTVLSTDKYYYTKTIDGYPELFVENMGYTKHYAQVPGPVPGDYVSVYRVKYHSPIYTYDDEFHQYKEVTAAIQKIEEGTTYYFIDGYNKPDGLVVYERDIQFHENDTIRGMIDRNTEHIAKVHQRVEENHIWTKNQMEALEDFVIALTLATLQELVQETCTISLLHDTANRFITIHNALESLKGSEELVELIKIENYTLRDIAFQVNAIFRIHLPELVNGDGFIELPVDQPITEDLIYYRQTDWWHQEYGGPDGDIPLGPEQWYEYVWYTGTDTKTYTPDPAAIGKRIKDYDPERPWFIKAFDWEYQVTTDTVFLDGKQYYQFDGTTGQFSPFDNTVGDPVASVGHTVYERVIVMKMIDINNYTMNHVRLILNYCIRLHIGDENMIATAAALTNSWRFSN